jgi:hypothetical protein
MVVDRVCHGAPLSISNRNCFFKTDFLDSFLTLFQLSCSVWIIRTDFFNLGKDCFSNLKQKTKSNKIYYLIYIGSQ